MEMNLSDTATIRHIDDLGRLVIPKNIRERMNIFADDAFNILIDEENDSVIFKKHNVLNAQQNNKFMTTIIQTLHDSLEKKYMIAIVSNLDISNNTVAVITHESDRNKNNMLKAYKQYTENNKAEAYVIQNNKNPDISYFVAPICLNENTQGAVILQAHSCEIAERAKIETIYTAKQIANLFMK